MRRYKNSVITFLFLINFLGCIGVNCARNINLLSHSEKTEKYGLSSDAVIKTSASSVYLLMDKKENKTQKNPCGDLLISTSDFRPSYSFSHNWAIVAKSVSTRPIYMAIRNLRI